jgi:DNA-binding GntR family transcriptional regulator
MANKTKVVRGLLKELLEGKWQVSDRLTEAEACERFKVSRTPVREALFELQGLGLLEIRRNCGAVMLAFGPKELANIYAVRALLEVEATRLAASNADSNEVEELIDAFGQIIDSSDPQSYCEHGQQLHRFVAKTSGNMSLAAEISRYNNLIQSMRQIIDERGEGDKKISVHEHLEILESLKLRKPREAAAAMRRHLDRTVESAINELEAFRALPA